MKPSCYSNVRFRFANAFSAVILMTASPLTHAESFDQAISYSEVPAYLDMLKSSNPQSRVTALFNLSDVYPKQPLMDQMPSLLYILMTRTPEYVRLRFILFRRSSHVRSRFHYWSREPRIPITSFALPPSGRCRSIPPTMRNICRFI